MCVCVCVCVCVCDHRSCRNRRRRMPSDADRCASHVRAESKRRFCSEPQRADRWATTADSVRGADDSSTVGCRVPCAPRECRSAGSRGSIGLRVNSTHPSAGEHVADNARAHSSAFSRATCALDDTCRLQGRAAAQAAAKAKRQKPPRARTPLSKFKAAHAYIHFTLINTCFQESLCGTPKSRFRRNVPMPVTLLVRVTHHSAMSCTSGRAQWPIKPRLAVRAKSYASSPMCAARCASESAAPSTSAQAADSRMNAAPLRPSASVRLHNRVSASPRADRAPQHPRVRTPRARPTGLMYWPGACGGRMRSSSDPVPRRTVRLPVPLARTKQAAARGRCHR